jgi:hypothetical protein
MNKHFSINPFFVFALPVLLISSGCFIKPRPHSSEKVSVTDTAAPPLPLLDSINTALIGTWTRIETKPPDFIPAPATLQVRNIDAIEFMRDKKCRLTSGGQLMKQHTFNASNAILFFGPRGCTGLIEQPYTLKDSLLVFAVRDWNGELLDIAYVRR